MFVWALNPAPAVPATRYLTGLAVGPICRSAPSYSASASRVGVEIFNFVLSGFLMAVLQLKLTELTEE